VGALCLLAGCSSLQQPTVAPALPQPAGWTAAIDAPGSAGDPAALARWWRRFDDPTLGALVERSLLAATDVQAAEARLRAARAQRDLAAAALRPSAGANASAQVSDAEGRPPARQYRAGFDAAWELDLWGGIRAGVDAARAEVQASAATLGQTRVSLAAEVAATYIELRSAQARLATLRANVANLERTLRIVIWREEAGLVTRLDVEQQRTAVEQARAALPALQTATLQAMNALAVLAGEAPGALHPMLRAEAALPVAPAELALAIPATVLAQRADLQAAEARVRAAAARVDAADAERLPSVQLSGSIGLNALSLAGLSSGAGVASLLASLNVPVFDGGRIAAQVRGQEAVLDEARANQRAAWLAALQEVEDTLVALRGSGEQLASRRAAAAAARRAATLAEQRYAAGLIDFASLLQTQRSQLVADDEVTTASAALVTQHVRLYKALGGGWTPDTGPDPNGSNPTR
jgi:NodT family efflux transporter outer membrane factor (OMF) lipoprotein